jgi:hypothetical protein
VRRAEGNQLEVAAVLEADQRIVRRAVGVRAAALDGDAEFAVIGDGLLEVVHADHHVVK